MSDLTDEEILATRRLHGLDDGLYKETKMKDIEVGDYIRTKAGIVGKVIKVLSNRVFLDNLGYAKKQITDEFISYSKREKKYRNMKEWEICINFNKYDKYMGVKNKYFFSLEEMEAIIKIYKEFGWI